MTDNTWIPWKGGKNPAPGEMVDVQFRGHHYLPLSYSTGKSEQWHWAHMPNVPHIVAYRIAEAPTEGERALLGGSSFQHGGVDNRSFEEIVKSQVGPDWQAFRAECARTFMAVLLPITDEMFGTGNRGVILERKAFVAVEATDALVLALKGGE